jgi:hypothetical protein
MIKMKKSNQLTGRLSVDNDWVRAAIIFGKLASRGRQYQPKAERANSSCPFARNNF